MSKTCLVFLVLKWTYYFLKAYTVFPFYGLDGYDMRVRTVIFSLGPPLTFSKVKDFLHLFLLLIVSKVMWKIMIACTNDHKLDVGLYTLFTLQQMFLKIETFSSYRPLSYWSHDALCHSWSGIVIYFIFF